MSLKKSSNGSGSEALELAAVPPSEPTRTWTTQAKRCPTSILLDRSIRYQGQELRAGPVELRARIWIPGPLWVGSARQELLESRDRVERAASVALAPRLCRLLQRRARPHPTEGFVQLVRCPATTSSILSFPVLRPMIPQQIDSQTVSWSSRRSGRVHRLTPGSSAASAAASAEPSGSVPWLRTRRTRIDAAPVLSPVP